MNASCYKIIFSKRLGALVAVGENATTSGKTASGQGTRHVMAGLMLTCMIAGNTQAQSSVTAHSLPQGGTVNSGAAAISTNGAQMTIRQSTDKASINWNSFNIGSSAAVNISQPNAQSVLLNRVTGNDPSQILGKLSANGQVILLNPNGIVFGKNGSVTASSFTASTFDLSDSNFNQNIYKYSRNGSTSAVVNQGKIEVAAGNFVALLGATVTNEGQIIAPQSHVIMAAGESATLSPTAPASSSTASQTSQSSIGVSLSQKVRLELEPASINATVNNTSSGVILTEGGQVLMQAAALSDAVASITHSGQIDTTGMQAGRVYLLAEGGTIKVDGRIKANSTLKGAQDSGPTGGAIIIGRDEDTGNLAKATDVSGAVIESQGGFVETSGHYLNTRNISVKAKEWLLDPTEITIVASNTPATNVTSTTSGGTSTYQFTGATRVDTSEVLKSDIETAINQGTNVTIESRHGPSFGTGNITIATALNFNNTGATDATLKLSAVNGITQNAGASITATGSKLVNVIMDAQGKYSGQDINDANSKGITLNSTITTNGAVTLTGISKNTTGGFANSGIVFNSGSGVTASQFNITGQQIIPSSSVEYAGIYFAGNNSFITSSGASTMTGTSTSSGLGAAGIYLGDASTLSFNSGSGSIAVSGTNAITRGIRFGFTSANSSVNTNGNVIFDGNNEIFFRAALNVQSGSASVKGNLVNLYNSGNIVANSGTTVNLEGATVSLGTGSTTSISPSSGASFNLNIKADEISFLNSSTINVGTGTVNISAKTTSNEIQLGTGSNTGILGISQANLDSISAGQLVIGDANTTGLITTHTVTTAASTGHLTLRSRGGIALNGALAVGGSSGSKNLTLYGSDTASASNTTQGSSGSIKATGLELKGSNATHTLTNASNDISTLAGNTLAVNYIDTNGFAVGTVNTTGLTATGNISLTAGTNATVTQSAAIQAAGLELKGSTASYSLTNTSNDIATLAADVKSLSYSDATGFAIGTVNTQGVRTTANTTLEAGANGSNASVTQSQIITAAGLELKGSNASYSLNGAGANGNAVSTLAANAKALAFVNASTLNVGTVNSVGITTNAGASIITKSGNLSINQAISNTGAGASGDIVMGAGTSSAAGTGSGGDIKTNNGIVVTQGNASGKTFIYTGQASSTGNLSFLDASLSNLDLSAIGSGQQNADSYVAYPANNFGISGSTAATQVMFREKVAIGALAGDTLTKTYGNASTKSNANSTLFSEMQTQLKVKNTGTSTRSASAGTFRISNAALIDTLSGILNAASYSGSSYLNANSSGYTYGTLNSSKYTSSIAANTSKVVIEKATAELSAQRDYNGNTSLSNVTINTGVVGADGVNAETLTFSNAVADNKNVSANGTNFVKSITLGNGSNGGDASNYTFLTTYDSVKNHVSINPAALTVTATAVTKTYDGTVDATGTGDVGSLAGAGSGDQINSTGSQVFLDKNYGAGNKTVRASGVTIKDTSNADVTDNYSISYIDNTTSTINQAALTIKVNDTSMFVTQDARTATNQLYSYTGFVNGETASTALIGGALVASDRSYTDPSNTLVPYRPAAGSYNGVYGLTTTPTAVSNNYAITVQNGNLRVVPADKLLITVGSQAANYGTRTASNAGFATNNSVSAQYCLVASNCSGANLVNLTMTQLNGNEWKATDSSGSFVMFSTTINAPTYSSGGYLNAGHYTYDTTQISPLTLPNSNFTGRETNGGVLTINTLAANLSASSASKIYDGTTDISGAALTLNNLLTGDVVTGSIGRGILASKNVGNNIGASYSSISLTGADAANYYLTSHSVSGTASITPKILSLVGTTVANKPFDGNTNATVTTNGSLTGFIGSETVELTSVTGTFDTASAGTAKTVTLLANLRDGSNGGLASNYAVANSTTQASITTTNSSSNTTQASPIIRPSEPVLPQRNAINTKINSSKSIANPYLAELTPQSENTGRCNFDTRYLSTPLDGLTDMSNCLCEAQHIIENDGLAICYEVNQTSFNQRSQKPEGVTTDRESSTH
jgi:filamentous hemagglutinin family protein